MFNPPCAQNANKRRSNSLDDDVEERIEPGGKKPRPMTSPIHIPTPNQSVPVMQVPGTSSSTHGTLNDFGSRYSTADGDFSRRMNGAHLQYDPRATVDPKALQRIGPQTQIEQPQQHSAAPEPMPQSDLPFSFPTYEDMMQQQNAETSANPMNGTAFADGRQVTSDTVSPVLTSEYNASAEHAELLPNPLEEVELAQAAGGLGAFCCAATPCLQQYCLIGVSSSWRLQHQEADGSEPSSTTTAFTPRHIDHIFHVAFTSSIRSASWCSHLRKLSSS